MPDKITSYADLNYCDFEDCTEDPAVRRGPQRFCAGHAAELSAADADSAIICARCPQDAEYTVGDLELCRTCADEDATLGPASAVAQAAKALYIPLALRGRCDFDECQAGASQRREALQLCSQHAEEFDEMQAMQEAEQVEERRRKLRMLAKHLEAAQAAMVAWFVDASWLVYLEVGPHGLGLRLERSERTVGSCTLRADSNCRALALELLKAAEAHS